MAYAAAAVIPLQYTLPSIPTISPALGILQARDLFLGSLVSDGTKTAYGRHIERFAALMGLTTIGQIENGHLMVFRDHLLADGRGPATHAQIFIALRSFLSWAAMLDGLRMGSGQVKNILKVPRVTVLNPYLVLNEDEIVRYLEEAQKANARDYAMMLVFLGAGLRVGEVVKLTGLDLCQSHDGGSYIHVHQGKGKKDRKVPVQAEVPAAICAYLLAAGRVLGTKDPLFQEDGHRISTRTCVRLVHAYCKAAGVVKRITPHSLRHTYAIGCLRSGTNIVKVAKLLGHASIATTQRYVAHLEMQDMVDAVPGFLVGRPAVIEHSAPAADPAPLAALDPLPPAVSL
jgi:integrase/recombinase XerD